MKKSLKASLLSALIFPGVGYFVLGQSRKALAVIALGLAALAVMLNFIFSLALPIAEKIQQGSVPPDVEQLSVMVHQSLLGSDSTSFNGALLVIVLAWLISTVDGYIIGKKMDDNVNSDHALS